MNEHRDSAKANAYGHSSADRPNQPTSEAAPLMTKEDRAPVDFEVPRRLPESIAKVYESGIEVDDVNLDRDLHVHPVLAWDRKGSTSQIEGNATADATHRFEGVPLYTREKITPALLLEQLRRKPEGQRLPFDFDGLGDDALQWEWYQHSGSWQDRLIHGDSAAVMQSLIAKDGLAGKVQMIYFDPPYGQKFKSNFQTTVDKLSTPDNADAIPVGDTLPMQAFVDSYRNGIHSYLNGVHERLVLARELLTESGSIFLQIGDINVHRLALVLDEVFGPENRIATITWRPTSSSRSKTLPETASYLLWYAKERKQCKYNQLFEQQNLVQIMEDWNRSFSPPRITSSRGTPRKLTSLELNSVNFAETNADSIYQAKALTSQGRSEKGRTREVHYQGRRYFCGHNYQWRVSIHDSKEPICSPWNENGDQPQNSPPCPDPKPCGLCRLGWANRIDGSRKNLEFKWYLKESPGRKIDNVWAGQKSPKRKRYVVQTANSVIERCILMTTEPGELVLDPTCGSGVTAEMAEEWGRRWITIDASRVAIAVARQKIATSTFPWHQISGGGNDPADGFVCKEIKHISAGRLADPNTDWNNPKNIIKIVDQTEIDKKRVRLASPFTVESHSPFSYLPFDSEMDEEEAGDWGIAAGEIETTILDALKRASVCNSNGAQVLLLGDHERWPEARLATHGIIFTHSNSDKEHTAGLMIGAPDATITARQVEQAVVETRKNAPGSSNLIAVGFAFDPDVQRAIGPCKVHLVSASKDLQIPELAKKGNDGGTFTLLGEPDCEVTLVEGGKEIVVNLLGCDSYDPSSGVVKETNRDHIVCWMIDTDHDQWGFVTRLTYFPNGLTDDAGIKEAMKSLGDQLAPNAQSHFISFKSQSFPVPPDDRPIAVKVITDTGAEMNTVIHPDQFK